MLNIKKWILVIDYYKFELFKAKKIIVKIILIISNNFQIYLLGHPNFLILWITIA